MFFVFKIGDLLLVKKEAKDDWSNEDNAKKEVAKKPLDDILAFVSFTFLCIFVAIILALSDAITELF